MGRSVLTAARSQLHILGSYSIFSPICLHTIALSWLLCRDYTISLSYFMTVVSSDAMSMTVSSQGNLFYTAVFYMTTCVIL